MHPHLRFSYYSVPKVRGPLSFEVLLPYLFISKGKIRSAITSVGMAPMAGTGFMGCGIYLPDLVLPKCPPIVTSVYRVSMVGVAVGVLGVFFEWGATLCGAVRVGAWSGAEA